MEGKKSLFLVKHVFIPFSLVAFMWFIYIVEYIFHYNFNSWGIYPRTIKGLRGIVCSPFIHGGIAHLASNSIPMLVMVGTLYYFYKPIATKIMIVGTVLTGLLTWIIGRSSYHIGASGVIYLLVSFIFFSGIIRKYYRLVAVSLTVVFLYGGLIWYVLPIDENISWEGHLSGFVIGFVLALIYKKQGPQPEKFEYSKNEAFEKLFDENGNFNPPVETINKLEE